jgi:hypothetical protein
VGLARHQFDYTSVDSIPALHLLASRQFTSAGAQRISIIVVV